ncbi:MAG: DUF6268 family outer membrane beta-barrel protein, partial [Pseudomonadota bacterium]
MSFHRWSCAAATVLAALFAVTGAAHAQDTGWNPFVAVTPIYQGSADLDNGGDFSFSGVTVRAGVARDLGGGNRAGVTFNYDYLNYSFSNPVAFGGVAPWNTVQRYGVTVPLSFPLRDGWSFGVAPSVDWFRENGAKSGDSVAWGATFSATKQFQDGNRIGVGLGVFEQIEDTVVVPFLAIDWRLSDRWRLINPLAAGPTGGAGLELDYRFDGGWTMGVGVAYRRYRFRLSETGPVPNGVGEERGVPVFFRATYGFTRQLSLNMYAGVVAGGRLRVEDPSGNVLRQSD